MKLTTGLENFTGMKDLSFASVEIDKNCWLTLPRWKCLCHSLARDQPQPGSFFERPREAEKRNPGNEVANKPGLVLSNIVFRNKIKQLSSVITDKFCGYAVLRSKLL